MSGAALVLVFVAAAEAHTPATASMLRAARAAVGDSATLVVREVASAPDDASAIAAADDAHAAALAEVSWEDARHLVAHVRIHFAGATSWSDRELGFEAKDAEGERGRTVGFALASMLPERAAEPEPAPPPPTPTTPPLLVAPAVALSPRREQEGGDVVAPFTPRGSIDAAAIGSVGFGGDAGGIGAMLALRWHLGEPFALRLGAGLRTGDVDAAAATSRTYVFALGFAWHHELSAPKRLGIGARVDFLALREQLSHFDFDDAAPVSAARWVPGADLLVEADWRLSPSVAVFLAAGVESAFGRTNVVLAGAEVAVIPPLRGVSEAGVQARF